MYKDGMTISEVLATVVADRDLTQAQAADRLGVRQPVVSRWISGENTPSDQHVPALVKFTGLPKAKVLAAIHEQRSNRAGLGERLTKLEAQVSALERTVDRLLRKPGERAR